MIPRRFCATAHREYDRITPTGGELAVPNPYKRIKDRAEMVMALAREMACDDRESERSREAWTNVILLCKDMPDDAGAAQRLAELQLADMRTMCDEGIELAQENNVMRRELEARAPESPAIAVPLTREPRTAASGE